MQDRDSGCGFDMMDLGNLWFSLGLDCGSPLWITGFSGRESGCDARPGFGMRIWYEGFGESVIILGIGLWITSCRSPGSWGISRPYARISESRLWRSIFIVPLPSTHPVIVVWRLYHKNHKRLRIPQLFLALRHRNTKVFIGVYWIRWRRKDGGGEWDQVHQH